MPANTNSLSNVLSFDGIDDFLALPALDFDFSKGFTVEAWARWQSFKNWSRIIDLGSGAAANNIVLGNAGTSRKLGLAVYGTQGGGVTLSSPGEVLPQGAFLHVAATIDADGIATLYVDGEVVHTQKAQVPHRVRREQSYVGRSNWNSDGFFHGQIAELRLWSVVRTAAELKTGMTQGVSGTENGLVGYWPLSEGSGSVVRDRSKNAAHAAIQGATWEKAEGSFARGPAAGGLPTLGPVGGGAEATFWNDLPEVAGQSLTGIQIVSGDVVDNLQGIYGSVQAPLRGSDLTGRGNPPQRITLAADDPIVEIKGAIVRFHPNNFLTKLTFKTLKGNSFGPYGRLNGQPFELVAPSGMCVTALFGMLDKVTGPSARAYPAGLGVTLKNIASGPAASPEREPVEQEPAEQEKRLAALEQRVSLLDRLLKKTSADILAELHKQSSGLAQKITALEGELKKQADCEQRFAVLSELLKKNAALEQKVSLLEGELRKHADCEQKLEENAQTIAAQAWKIADLEARQARPAEPDARPAEPKPAANPGLVSVSAQGYTAASPGATKASAEHPGLTVNADSGGYLEYLVGLPKAGKWYLHVRMTAADRRPCALIINGAKQSAPILGETTGSWQSDKLGWFVYGPYDFRQGDNQVRTEGENGLPHLKELAFTESYRDLNSGQ